MDFKDKEKQGYTPKGTYLDAGLSDGDKAAVGELSKQWSDAYAKGDQAGMDAAHQAAEAIRAGYGYSGGGDGSEYIAKDSGGTVSGGGTVGSWGGGKFSYSDKPSYANRYQGKIDELTAQILGRAAFEYDPEKDPTYQQYKESYTKNGQRAMQDTLGQVSARTGGLASSYAGSAAQQTYDGYMSALADKIPELKQLAYEMYLDELNGKRADLSMLMGLDDSAYNKFLTDLGQYNTDRSFDYGMYQNEVGDSRYKTEWAYQLSQDQLNNKRYEEERDYEQAMAKAQILAAGGDFSGYKALGYTDAEIAGLKSAYDREQAAVRTGGSSGRSSSGSRTGSGGSSPQTGNKWAAVEDWVSRYGGDAAEDYIKENYKTLGYSSQSAALSGWRNHLLEMGSGKGDGDAQISNRHGDSWLYIPGHGRFTYGEVENYVNSGKIIETYDEETNTYTYQWNDGKK